MCLDSFTQRMNPGIFRGFWGIGLGGEGSAEENAEFVA